MSVSLIEKKELESFYWRGLSDFYLSLGWKNLQATLLAGNSQEEVQVIEIPSSTKLRFEAVQIPTSPDLIQTRSITQAEIDAREIILPIDALNLSFMNLNAFRSDGQFGLALLPQINQLVEKLMRKYQLNRNQFCFSKKRNELIVLPSHIPEN